MSPDVSMCVLVLCVNKGASMCMRCVCPICVISVMVYPYGLPGVCVCACVRTSVCVCMCMCVCEDLMVHTG